MMKRYDFKKKSEYIGYKLRQARIENKLSQQDVGDLLGIAYVTVGSYERGRLRISVDLLYELSKIYDRPISFFFEEDPELMKKYEEKKKKIAPKYNLDENLEFSLEFSIQTYLKAYGLMEEDIYKLTDDVIIYIKKHL